MNATHSFICQENLINPLTKIGIQMASILVLSHLLHLALKVFYNSGPVAHILAGVILSPAGLSRIPEVKDFFSLRSTLEYYPMLGFSFGVLFMFHIGLEVDISYIMRNLKTALTVSYWGLAINFVLGGIVSFFLISFESVDHDAILIYSFSMITYLADTSPQAVARVVAEVKIATSNIGRLAVCCSLINDLSCIIIFLLIIAFQSWKMIGRGILALLITSGAIFFNNYMARWFNRRNRTHKYLRNPEFFIILSHLFLCCCLIEALSFNSAINCFLIGLLFPREGKSMRTMLYKLSYVINNFVLPLYFGLIGFQCSLVYFTRWDSIAAIVVMVVLSVFGKLVGTVAACNHLKLPIDEGILIGFLMNLKGHLDLVFLNGVSTDKLLWTLRSQDMLVACKVIDAVISGIGIAICVKKHERSLTTACRALEPEDPESELRVLGCVYGSRHAPVMVSAISALGGSKSTPVAPYLMHLIELSQTQKSSTSLYHELDQEDELSYEDYGGNDVLEINEVVDAFAAETNVFIHQIKVVSSFVTMYEDVCDHAEDHRISLVLMPFHKHQRIDGKLESGKEGIRTTNQRVLRHAPCSVGIIVSRGPAGVPCLNQILSSESVQEVATLFFGGPDDQEALACSKRIAAHPYVKLTVIRFLPDTSPLSEGGGNAINLEDDVYLADFYNRYIRSGKVGYVEKQVNNGLETVEVLREIANMYSLFVVGKGKRGHSTMTTGMSDWEECPELGIVGDILASPEFNIGGSVLIIQQHRNTNI